MPRLLAYLEVPRLYPGYALSLEVFALRRNVEILAEGLPVSIPVPWAVLLFIKHCSFHGRARLASHEGKDKATKCCVYNV